MKDIAERDLRKSPIFCDKDESLWDLRENMPWPAAKETLLRPAVGSEEHIYPYSEWVRSDLEQLKFFAMHFRDGARDVVRTSLKSRSRPDEIIYVVGFLYRHAIELHLKAIIADSASFHVLSTEQQREVLDGHSLHRLWNLVRAEFAEFIDKDSLDVVEKQMLQIHELDRASDGFRYPFSFAGKSNERQPLLKGLAYASFDNFVWILDGLCNWLSAAEAKKEHDSDLKAEMRTYFSDAI